MIGCPEDHHHPALRPVFSRHGTATVPETRVADGSRPTPCGTSGMPRGRAWVRTMGRPFAALLGLPRHGDGGRAGTALIAVAIANTAPYNMARVPAISVPCGTTGAGLPIGFQIAGRPFDETTALRAAHAYEQAVVTG